MSIAIKNFQINEKHGNVQLTVVWKDYNCSKGMLSLNVTKNNVEHKWILKCKPLLQKSQSRAKWEVKESGKMFIIYLPDQMWLFFSAYMNAWHLVKK